MTDATVTKKSKNPKAPKLFPDELIDAGAEMRLAAARLRISANVISDFG
nr:hypothetical protein [Burkholderia ubonensis]